MKRGVTFLLGRVALAAALSAIPVQAVDLGSGVGLPQPILLRISGFVGAAPHGISTLGALTLGVGKTVVTLDLSGVQTLNGPLTEGPAALRQFELYDPNLLVVGDASVLRAIATAPARTPLTVFGYIHAGARRMYVVQVEPV